MFKLCRTVHIPMEDKSSRCALDLIFNCLLVKHQRCPSLVWAISPPLLCQSQHINMLWYGPSLTMTNSAFIWRMKHLKEIFTFCSISLELLKYILFYRETNEQTKDLKKLSPLEKFCWIHDISNDFPFLFHAGHSLELLHSFISLPRPWLSEIFCCRVSSPSSHREHQEMRKKKKKKKDTGLSCSFWERAFPLHSVKQVTFITSFFYFSNLAWSLQPLLFHPSSFRTVYMISSTLHKLK